MVIILPLLGFGCVACLGCIGFEVASWSFSKIEFAFSFGKIG
jgi:hypothetical protein